ncbi:MAG TPA: GreA/GreB family elongation factor [Firmicutes bacterium]|nr:GreA/GreB family elongation factor [Bacillota bacterium]
MTESVLLGELKEALITHLVEVEEQCDVFIEEFFPHPSPEREQAKKKVEEYINTLEGLVQEAHQIKEKGTFPLVIIGSRVELKDLKTNELLVVQLILPLGELPGENGISPLSPLGQALFLKKIGDEIEVEAPGGTFQYRIMGIYYPADR